MNRKFSAILFLIVLMTAIISGCQKQSTDNLQIEGNNLILLIDRPTEGIIELGRVNWSNLDLAVKELYEFFADENVLDLSTKSSSYNLYFAFCENGFDKYGNPERTHEERISICTLSTEDVKKYRSSKFFDSSYKISDAIRFCYDNGNSTPILVEATINGQKVYIDKSVPGDSLPKNTGKGPVTVPNSAQTQQQDTVTFVEAGPLIEDWYNNAQMKR